MANKNVCITNQQNKPIKILKWKIREGSTVSIGRLILIYQLNNDDSNVQMKLKCTKAGTIKKIYADENAILNYGDELYEIEPCNHPTIMNDMCAECGEDLRKNEQEAIASVPMVHAIPDLKVSEEQAQIIGKADSERLLNDRKLVLLVDLDQTLIHTTNDNIPPNIKDVYHFQLYGPQSPWYHTRLRPGTHQFLENVCSNFELHICTFGTRNYAHMIAMFLDRNQKYFSNRILSRDECFDPTSKKANLKALFPCGDNLVCIIDDREDVWSNALNLIHVKPYHFFRHTGDINAPPGLDKHEEDEVTGIDLSQIETKVKKDDVSSQNGKSGKVDGNCEETSEKKSTDEKNGEVVSKGDESAEGESKNEESGEEISEDRKCGEELDNDEKSGEELDNDEKSGEELDNDEKSGEDLNNDGKSREELNNDEKSGEDLDNDEKSGDKLNNDEKSGEKMNNDEGSGEICKKNGKKFDGQNSLENPSKTVENCDKKRNGEKENDLIEIEDPDSYLLYLETILKQIHRTFYEKYDTMESGEVPDLKQIIPYVKSQVLKGKKLCFSGLVPTHFKLEQSKAYMIARSLGAEITQDLEDDTTHLVAVRPGTAKVNSGKRRKNLKIVTPDWLWCCAERWEHVDEKIFPLNSKGSKNRHPPAHCSSPEHVPEYPVHNTPASRKRTPSGRFMDTINPLMSFSSADIADMDKEVEDILDDASDSGSSSSEDENKEKTLKNESDDVNNLNLSSSSSSSSSSRESLNPDHPHGYKRNFDEMNTDDDELPSTKFRRGELIEDDESQNSENDDGEWNMMGEALEREFLSND